MDSMSDLFPALDSAASPSPSASGGGGGGGDAGRIGEVRAFLTSHFDAAGRPVPSFEYTPRSVAHLHPIATLSLARSRSAAILAADLRLKAAEYRSQAARLREILDAACLSHERLSPKAIAHAQVLAGVANLLNIRDTEMTSFVVAMGDLFLRKSDVEEKREKVDKESKGLLDYTRKAIAKLNDLKKILMKFENEIAARQGQMLQWQKNLALMDQKEKQYVMEEENYEARLKNCGYKPEFNHGVLMEMAEHKKDLEKKTKPILDTLRSYQDLPPDKALAALAIEDKKRQYAAAEKYLEEVLHSALTTPGL